MLFMLKKLLNRSETATFQILRSACNVDDVFVHAKVGLKEVFDRDYTSLAPELRNYCFAAHFDFLITDTQSNPLFAVEFDGPTHRTAKQKVRDEKKNVLCKIFNFPLLRINSKYLHPLYKGMNLLAWFTEYFFIKHAFDAAQEEGILSPDDGISPHRIYSIGDDRRWPLWLSCGVREQLRELSRSGKCRDWIPSYLVGRDREQTCRAVSVIAITDQIGVFVKTAMKSQQFPISEEDAIQELIVLEAFESLQNVLSGRQKPLTISEIDAKIREFDKQVKVTRLSSFNRRIPTLQNNRSAFTIF